MLSAAILAGGQARRFGGRDKRLLVVGGRTVFERQLRELEPISDDLMVVGGADTSARAEGEAPRVRSVADRVPGAGPLAGLDAALAAARHPLVALVACDMPFLSGRLLAHLAGLIAGAAARHEPAAAVPLTERGYHPLCAVYTTGCRRVVADQLDSGRLRMTDLLARLDVTTVDAAELGRFGRPHCLLANVNTAADYDAAEARLLQECHET